MKLQIASDLHLRRHGYFDFPEAESDVLILAGDIAPKLPGIDLVERLADSGGSKNGDLSIYCKSHQCHGLNFGKWPILGIHWLI